MTPEELRDRTKQFALRIIRLIQSLPKSDEARILGRQLLKSGTSVGANYRAACVGRYHAEFTAKMGIVLEEADESCFWLELMEASGVIRKGTDDGLIREAGELVRILGASCRTARGAAGKSRTSNQSPNSR